MLKVTTPPIAFLPYFTAGTLIVVLWGLQTNLRSWPGCYTVVSETGMCTTTGKPTIVYCWGKYVSFRKSKRRMERGSCGMPEREKDHLEGI